MEKKGVHFGKPSIVGLDQRSELGILPSLETSRPNSRSSVVPGFEHGIEQSSCSRAAPQQAVKAAQAYINALSRQPPPAPPGGGAGCKESCCWRWLTAMLLQELQVLRRTVTEAREAFVEQERNFVRLESVPTERDYSGLIEQHRKMQAEHRELEREFPVLEAQIRTTREAMDVQRDDIKKAEEEVARLKCELAEHEENQHALQNRVRKAEQEAARTKSSCEGLQWKLEEIMKKKSRQDVVKELVISDKAILVTQRELLQDKNKKAPSKRGGNTSTVASASAPKPKPKPKPTIAVNNSTETTSQTTAKGTQDSPDPSPKMIPKSPRSSPKKTG